MACRSPSGRPAPRIGELKGANLLLITIDTLRQDRVGVYGNRDGLTPRVDRLAARGIRYTHAFSTAPLTLPAHASIMTGLLPRRHGIHNNTRFRLADGLPTLANVAHDAGYRTGAFVGAFVLDGRFGLNRGFDEYDDRLPSGDHAGFHFAERVAADVVARAGNWILQPANTPAPFFAWVHLFDPHAPYNAPAEYQSRHAPYDAEVAYADDMLGRLLDRLEAAHLLDRTLVVVTADHGESLGEHGETTHGLFAYNATLAVPLIVSSPAIAPASDDTPASHADVMPTILDLLGLATPLSIDGASLLRHPPRDRPLFFEALDASLTRGWAPLRGVIQSDWKYIDLPQPELYALRDDPQELHNRVDDSQRSAALKRVLQQQAGGVAAAPAVSLDAEAAERLRSLGYSMGRATTSQANASDDPKALVGLNERFNGALTAFDEGRTDQALSAFMAILRERPDFAAARASASTLLVATGHAHEAVDLLRAGLSIQQDSPDLLAKLGSALRAGGDLRASAEAFERARRSGNDSADVLSDLAIVYAGTGQADRARATFEQLIARNPASATSWFNLGLFELQSGHGEAAVSAFRRATTLDPAYGDAWNALGAGLIRTDPSTAVDAWRHAERLLPDDFDLLFNLGMVLADGKTPGDAVPYLQRFVRDAPPAHYASDIAHVRSVLDRVRRGAS